ncbi:hypothetical protein VOLCADRAFT_91392 [Volvox carteri f. nagariensis]|uniref:Uncharacterized protein n=1 Tax=Volvox carteri f. nagariensis TaxID=3068 RepID=D8TWY4_VOLCA|nr:uncharacterized protein VOLCADRAFT_91392 [Volvox carteri f. nagariensis]EFJ47916.1 hypothetical protein VOLCADRAFT_91392 [Volvox carteri f. nagariensis]|eukprot:XP_002951022.1 hypothetical protein VOLCADRAFT_91392 [Volvox carteri f. nagariensis]
MASGPVVTPLLVPKTSPAASAMLGGGSGGGGGMGTSSGQGGPRSNGSLAGSQHGGGGADASSPRPDGGGTGSGANRVWSGRRPGSGVVTGLHVGMSVGSNGGGGGGGGGAAAAAEEQQQFAALPACLSYITIPALFARLWPGAHAGTGPLRSHSAAAPQPLYPGMALQCKHHEGLSGPGQALRPIRYPVRLIQYPVRPIRHPDRPT